MSVFCKILTGLLWVIVICSLVFTAFQFSWFADAGVWVAKDAFDAEITQTQFLDGTLFFIMGAVPVLLLATICECIFLSEKAEIAENSVKQPRKEKRVTAPKDEPVQKDEISDGSNNTKSRSYVYR